ncbi:COG4799 Acetyl-CoA carboxylase, carboxyltransferase component (subunits alpha and beta) [Acidimicrobiia bacterium]
MTDSDSSADVPGGWGPALQDLAERRLAARAMGGEERLAKRRAKGQLDARERINLLLDPGSFRELGTLVGDVPGDGIVAGAGRVDGRPVMVGAEDFTVLAGSIGSGSTSKRWRIAELALAERIPLIMLLEGAGHRGGGGGGRAPTDLLIQAKCSGRIPVVSAVMGPSAGHGALIVPMSDFSVMTADGAVFTAGPPVVKESLGEDISKEDLGGPSVAVASGLIHNVAQNDVAALDMIRHYLMFFPSSAWSYPPRVAGADQEPRPTDELLSIIPRDTRKVYDMRDVLDVIFDDGSWFEVQAGFGPAMICALAHLGGEPVAVIANEPNVLAGSIDSAAADKAAHFITVADSFHLPLIFLADNPGMLPGSASERAGVLRSGARMFAAQTQAQSPKLHLTLRKAYGFGSMVMSMVGFDNQSATFAFPGATLGAMGASAMSRATGAKADEAAELREAELQASYRSASNLGFDELIDPRETRAVLIDALDRALLRRQVAAEPVSRTAIMP